MPDHQKKHSGGSRYKRWFPAAFLLLLVGLYYLVYARIVLNREYTPGGDTQLYWSFKYMLFYSIKYFHSFPWWEPTNYNGYPLYFHLVSGWTNYLGPFCLPSMAFFKLLTLAWDVNINDYIIFHQTLYVFTLNLIPLYLISKELTKTTAASLLPPFIFTFSYFQLMNFHDFYVYEALIAPLFFLYGLVRYANNRTKKNFVIFLVFLSLLFASLQNGIVMSAAYWGSLFTVLLIAFNVSLIRDTWQVLKEMAVTRKGKGVLVLLSALLIIGFAAAWAPFAINAGHLLKYRLTVMELPDGSLQGVQQPLEYDTSGGITNHPVPITNSEIWSIVLNWLPFPDVHDNLLRFAWDGHEYRYIGLVTIPLILTALILANRNRYVYISLLTFFICNAFFIYADKNLAYKVLFDTSDIIKNITNVSTILPRGGASLFLILLAGIGLDALLTRDPGSGTGPEAPVERLYRNSTTFLLIVALVLIGFGLLAWSIPDYEWMRHTLFHMGFYLLIFSFSCKLLTVSRSKVVVYSVLACLFIFTFMDLTVSSSSYLLNRHNFTPEDTSRHILIPYQKLADRGMTIPDKLRFGPAQNESELMYPPAYVGVYHNPFVLMWGTKEWLYFGTRDEGTKLLKNWNPKTRHMTSYPSFAIFSNARYIPFEAIKDLDQNKQWYDSEPLFYLHDQRLIGPEPPHSLAGSYELKRYAYNDVDMVVHSGGNGFLYFLDNYDRFWKAYLDGKQVPILRANFTFKAIQLPAGEHRVQWVYDPWPVKVLYGAYYVLLAAGLVVLYRVRREPWMTEERKEDS